VVGGFVEDLDGLGVRAGPTSVGPERFPVGFGADGSQTLKLDLGPVSTEQLLCKRTSVAVVADVAVASA
jgi:hypothetical protein